MKTQTKITLTDNITPKATLFGMPVYVSTQVPKNKIWFIKNKKVRNLLKH